MDNTQTITASSTNGEAVILDEESTKVLYKMFKSNDTADHKMGQLILNTCDVEKSIYYIWQLARSVYPSLMVNLRTKASRNFRDQSRLFFISQKGSRTFSEFLTTQGWNTPEIFQKLETDVISGTIGQCRNKYYNVTLTIKEEYKHLALNVEPINVETYGK